MAKLRGGSDAATQACRQPAGRIIKTEINLAIGTINYNGAASSPPTPLLWENSIYGDERVIYVFVLPISAAPRRLKDLERRGKRGDGFARLD